MPIPTREDIKAYFQTGDHPTQAEFAAMIDAMYDMAQQSDAKAAAAVATANAAEGRSARCFGLVKFVHTTTAAPTPTTLKANNCTMTVAFTLTGTSGAYRLYDTVVTIVPTTDFADVNFVVSPELERAVSAYMNLNSLGSGLSYGYVITRAVDEVQIAFKLAMMNVSETRFQFVIFD